MTYSLEGYLSMPWTYELEGNDQEGWYIGVKELCGCMSFGVDITEARQMIAEALELWLEVALEAGMDIPVPEAVAQDGKNEPMLPF